MENETKRVDLVFSEDGSKVESVPNPEGRYVLVPTQIDGFYIPRDEDGKPPEIKYFGGIDPVSVPADNDRASLFEMYKNEAGELIARKKRRHGEVGSWWHRQMQRTYDLFANPYPSIKRGRKLMRRAFSKHKAPVVSAAGKPTVEITLTEDNFFRP